ncbi:hypothetical protein TELCIR_10968 [Teladorsagia circumcincta]|uniref:Uncharacterized protein n=1 Tax=Teladorsagia circumcincta TaxID=45464 RepID=A0A2G9UAP3_TELCI|nr:hypothetical protein TELCIR_10968 [Teladorsagia circumcincta]
MTAPPDVVTPPPHRSSVPSRAQPPSEHLTSQTSYGPCIPLDDEIRMSAAAISSLSKFVFIDREEGASGDVGLDSDGEYVDDQPSTSSANRSRRSARHSKMSQGMDRIECIYPKEELKQSLNDSR